ncbi:MAG: ester cyclase [Sediminibacterium sp.]|nr:ester cyclase [Sediminibacterium sp.]MBX9779806.1 ester cyclase [Chitinophagaceae bacterium]
MKDQTEYNKQFIINHFEEFVNKKNVAVAFQNMTTDFLDHDEAGGIAIGPQAAVTMMEGVHKYIPDITVSIEDIIAEGDKVMVRNIWTGTTLEGKKIQFRGFVLWRLADGKIAERWATLTPPYQRTSEKEEW